VRKLAAAGNEFTLDADDLARIRGDLESRKAEVNREIERTLRDATAANEARTAAEAALARSGRHRSLQATMRRPAPRAKRGSPVSRM
jgi:hypothetical protein